MDRPFERTPWHLILVLLLGLAASAWFVGGKPTIVWNENSLAEGSRSFLVAEPSQSTAVVNYERNPGRAMIRRPPYERNSQHPVIRDYSVVPTAAWLDDGATPPAAPTPGDAPASEPLPAPAPAQPQVTTPYVPKAADFTWETEIARDIEGTQTFTKLVEFGRVNYVNARLKVKLQLGEELAKAIAQPNSQNGYFPTIAKIELLVNSTSQTVAATASTEKPPVVELIIPGLGLVQGDNRLQLIAHTANGPASKSRVYTVRVRSRPLVVQVDDSGITDPATPFIRIDFGTDDLTVSSMEDLAKKITLVRVQPRIAGPAVPPQTPATENGQPETKGASPSDPNKVELQFAPPLGPRGIIEVRSPMPLAPALYELRIKGGKEGITDGYGNVLAGNDPQNLDDFVMVIQRPIPTTEVTEGVGLKAASGPYVEFPDFAPPRDVPEGFNPEDKVETRVARLYYYRDAHRVAQIINRTAQSWIRAGAEMARQLADKTRQDADRVERDRKGAELRAVEAARQARAAETELAVKQQSFQAMANEVRRLRESNGVQVQRQTAIDTSTDDGKKQSDALGRQIKAGDEEINRLGLLAEGLAREISGLQGNIQNLREQEAEANQVVQRLQLEEDQKREEQFRKEVAAAREDPDTYAPGVLETDDPVRQVSVSVIGEGLIHLRGPLKGINIIRHMINQIDAPVGQVRVSIHTVQVNGERADRMEIVGQNIQREVDQARFLTMQSSEMLRKAVVTVASRKAEEARALFPGNTQEDRDQRYLYAFFGTDFVEELKSMDSEFLHSGNKLLGLHAMDTTSLSSAMLMMSLAKNSTRLEILDEFDRMIQTELPVAEQSYVESGMACPPKHSRGKQLPICFLAQNARFDSLRGFYNTEAMHDDTITPLQREFIRLGQIFKSYLVTEQEYKQRVRERAIIEERLGRSPEERLAEQRAAKAAEDDAKRAVTVATSAVLAQETQIRTLVVALRALAESHRRTIQRTAQSIAAFQSSVDSASQNQLARYAKIVDAFGGGADIAKIAKEDREGIDAVLMPSTNNGDTFVKKLFNHEQLMFKELINTIPDDQSELKCAMSSRIDTPNPIDFRIDLGNGDIEFAATVNPDGSTSNVKNFSDASKYLQDQVGIGKDLVDTIETNFELNRNQRRRLERASELLNRCKFSTPVDLMETITDVRGAFRELLELLNQLDDIFTSGIEAEQHILTALNSTDLNTKARDNWYILRDLIRRNLKGPLNDKIEPHVTSIESAFNELSYAHDKLQNAIADRDRLRRPLDHKKFLDMLIADLEDKYVELLEGTRAHTANIDNYLKRLTTALDDDFNNTFYYPTFREIRKASTFYDVQFGQTETTSVLANNRGFAKVTPQATMEFDLPERDIVLVEAMNGAKAMIDEYGALVNDPSFLALSKMNAGSSTAAPKPGTTGGASVVRRALPGLPGSTDEQFLAQNGPGRSQFGSAVENLIPDPAIYKFETGTGFEIRPVIQPDGQAVVFGFNYLYTTNIREPVRPDEKHLGRVKQHFVNTDVQLSNFELREVSRYQVALKAARTSRGVPLLEDVPIAGVLFRPLPSDESSLQQNQILAQATIFPTLFDLMGLRWAPVIADLDPLRLTNDEFVVRGRNRFIQNRVYDHSSEKVDEFLRVPPGTRRPDLYRTQETIPHLHPNGYEGPGLDQRDSTLQEGYSPTRTRPPTPFTPSDSPEGTPLHSRSKEPPADGLHIEPYPLRRQQRPATPLPLHDPRGS